MALFRSLLRIFSGSFNPYSMLEATSEEVSQEALRTIMLTNDYIATFHNQMATFATIFMGIIDIDSGALTYINAGHDPPAILRKSGGPEVLMPTGPAAGAFAEAQFKIKRTQLEPGDIFFGFTDGVTDALSPAGEAYGRSRLDALMDQPAASAEAFEETLKKELFDHIDDAAPIDDITILMVKRL
jgi:sigma-B regulation protein RsbU (phosphoserine phosphatase)